MGKGFGDILTTVGDIVATASGNPELIPVINGGSQLVQGRGIGNALTSAGTAFLGNEIGGVLGNQFPETFGSTFGTGGNTLTDLFGSTEGAGSFFGPGTIGGDLMGNFAPGSGLDNLSNSSFFSPSSTSSGIGGTPTSDSFTNTARDVASGGASAPSIGLPGATAGSGISNVGGGTAGGFVNAPDISIDGFSNNFNPGAGWTGGTPTDGFSLGGNAFKAPDDLGYGFGSAGDNFKTEMAKDLSSGGSSVGGNGQMYSGLLKAVLGGLTNNTNPQGYNAQINAGNQVAADYSPFLQAGTAATNTLSNLYGNNGPAAMQQAQQDWQNTPGYQFAKNQGISALDASAAARGNLLSGNQLKAVQDYGTGLADQTYQQAINNQQALANNGLNAANGVASGQVGAANAQAGKSGAVANNQNQMVGGVLNALFPGSDILSILRGGLGGGGNNGVLSSLFG